MKSEMGAIDVLSCVGIQLHERISFAEDPHGLLTFHNHDTADPIVGHRLQDFADRGRRCHDAGLL